MESRDASAQLVRNSRRLFRRGVDKNDNLLASQPLGPVRTTHGDIEPDGAPPNMIDFQRGRESISERTRHHEIDREVHGGNSPAALQVDLGERETQSLTTPVFYDIVEHLEISGKEYDAGRIT